MEIIVTILVGVFILILPGYVLSLAIFRKKKIDYIERLIVSFALSIAIVPLTVFHTNIVGVPITKLTIILQVIGIVLVSWMVIEAQEFFRKKKNEKETGK
jgi:uncharacterized membrane protein